MKAFNIAGPCRPGEHYMVAPEARLPKLDPLLDGKSYFVVHAPRQSGKTTAMRALAARLTAEGRYAALHVSCESARALRDVVAAEAKLWHVIERLAHQELPPELAPARSDQPTAEPLTVGLKLWAEACPRPVVLILDEIDALEGDPLRHVLSQLRAGFPDRPDHFPSSIVLCGLKDVRDYKMASGSAYGPDAGSSSPFNIMARSLRLTSFTDTEVRALYLQHTEETGQSFTEEALEHAWHLAQGQPWLINALAHEVIVEMGVQPPTTITAAHIDAARERLIVRRPTHLDSLLARLKEPRVIAVLQPIIAGDLPYDDPLDDEYAYVRDLGLIAVDDPPRFANPIYEEVSLRVLAAGAERSVLVKPRSFVGQDGRLELGRVVEGFAEFWRENGEILAAGTGYPEAAPLLVMMAWLHKFGNGQGGAITRELAVGSRRVDLLLRWPYTDSEGRPTWQREAFELKVWRDRDKRRDPVAVGLVQLDAYLSRLGLDHGVLVVFDARTVAPPIEDRTTIETRTTASGRRVTLLRA